MNFDQQLQIQLSAYLKEILVTLQLELSEQAQTKMIQYLELLSHWNQAYNLTAINKPQEMLIKHIADSLALVPWIISETASNHQENSASRWLDVGTGAGLPGVPLALALPHTQWTLLDSNGKKTRFLMQVKASLDLSNVEIVQSRIEEFKPAQLFTGIVARAWSSLPEMLEKIRRLLATGGKFFAMKASIPEMELTQLQLPYELHRLNVPRLLSERHLVVIRENQ